MLYVVKNHTWSESNVFIPKNGSLRQKPRNACKPTNLNFQSGNTQAQNFDKPKSILDKNLLQPKNGSLRQKPRNACKPTNQNFQSGNKQAQKLDKSKSIQDKNLLREPACVEFYCCYISYLLNFSVLVFLMAILL